MSARAPAKCVSCGGSDFTAPKDIHGYVPATFGWFGDPLVGFACATCGYVHLFLKPRKKVGERMPGIRGGGEEAPGEGGDPKESP